MTSRRTLGTCSARDDAGVAAPASSAKTCYPNDHEEASITRKMKVSCGSDAYVATKVIGASRDVGVAPTK